MARLKDILEPGETMILRDPSVWSLWVPAFMILAGLVNVLLLAPRLAPDSEGLFYDITRIVGGLIIIAAGISIYRLSRIWRLLVTDRRLLRRQGRQPYEEIRLAEVDEVRPYRLGDGLFVIARNQKIVIPCKEKRAARILAVIEAAKGTA